MTKRWIYTHDGQPAFYQTDEHIYSPDGSYSYWVSEGWWYRAPDGQASFYVSAKSIYAPNGRLAYYYGND